jgi:hypothetical protein
MKRQTAQIAAWLFILGAVCVQLFNNFACYQHDLAEALTTLWFPSIVLIPSIIYSFTDNPLRSVISSLVAILLYLFAYYVDCVRPDSGGGASMVYLVVVIYGTPLAAGLGLLAGPLCRWLGIRVSRDNQDA